MHFDPQLHVFIQRHGYIIANFKTYPNVSAFLAFIDPMRSPARLAGLGLFSI